MKSLIIVFIILFLSYDGMAQGSYRDRLTSIALKKEVKETKKIKNLYDKINDDLLKLNLVARLENERSKIVTKGLGAISAPLPKFDLCQDFLFPNSKKAKKCQNKLEFLNFVIGYAYSFTISFTNHRINNGVKYQILEKYAAIINLIEFEYEKLRIEKEKRMKFNLYKK